MFCYAIKVDLNNILVMPEPLRDLSLDKPCSSKSFLLNKRMDSCYSCGALMMSPHIVLSCLYFFFTILHSKIMSSLNDFFHMVYNIVVNIKNLFIEEIISRFCFY